MAKILLGEGVYDIPEEFPLLREPPLIGQVFTFRSEDAGGIMGIWDINEAKRLILENVEKHLIEYVSLTGVPHLYEMLQNVEIDKKHAMTTSLRMPGIYITRMGDDGVKRDYLIDGWHRLFKAVVTGTRDFPGIWMTEEEEKACRICDWCPGEDDIPDTGEGAINAYIQSFPEEARNKYLAQGLEMMFRRGEVLDVGVGVLIL